MQLLFHCERPYKTVSVAAQLAGTRVLCFCLTSVINQQSMHQFQKPSNQSLTPVNSSTLTPMHLRKAKLMFFWVRYPSSAVLKMYFPDIKFNKNNTAQLVKWFSNFSLMALVVDDATL
uniref:Uncharacterized protein n=1 Tax=Anopheles stephensi TaxID=30069 RepID=A0A182YF42_ANOST